MVEMRHSKKSEGEFSSTGSHQPSDAEHLAGVQGERNIGEFSITSGIPNLQDRGAIRHVASSDTVTDAASGHQFGQPMIVNLQRRKRTDLASVAKHRNTFGKSHDFLQSMADENNRQSALLEPADYVEQAHDFMVRQRRCRLVHEQELSVGGKTTADRHDLPLGDRKLADNPVDRQVCVETCQDLFSGLAHGLTAYGR